MSSKFFLSILLVSLLAASCASAPGAPQTELPILPQNSATPAPVLEYRGDGSLTFLSLEENGYAHLFAYQPKDFPFTRLTSGAWSDTQPALSPDHRQIAFASNRNGFWDLYILNLQNGEVLQVTDSPQYDAAPSWSPDGQWLAFETYINDNLEIAVVSAQDRAQPIVEITQDPAADHSPAWAPDGRHVAFISTRGGDSDVWLANLDLTGAERYQNLSATPQAAENFPQWNSSGSQLLWASVSQSIGASGLYVWDANAPERAAHWVSDGVWGAWNVTADQIASVTNSANAQYLAYYDLRGNLVVPPAPLVGLARGLAWGAAQLPSPLPSAFALAAAQSPLPLWSPVVTPAPDVPNQRWQIVPIQDVQAPYPQLHDLVDESFNALRTRVIADVGWDALASLENAFVPLTTALEPELGEDWLYTGRAFSINKLMAEAGWLTAQREDIGAQTYWRVYIRCNLQDGSCGEPIRNAPWNLSARYEIDPAKYEQGGEYAPVPPGYWVDFTALAFAYGWERLPALPNWRTYYAASRFTEFTLNNGMSWYAAMLELYPPEALATPTRVLPPTITPSRTPTFTPTPKLTSTPRPTRTPTISPTPTLSPTATISPTATFTPTFTATATGTPTPPTVIP